MADDTQEMPGFVTQNPELFTEGQQLGLPDGSTVTVHPPPKWEDVKDKFTSAYPDLDPEEIKSAYTQAWNLGAARWLRANSAETWKARILRRYTPFSDSAIVQALTEPITSRLGMYPATVAGYEHARYQESLARFKAGSPTEDDYLRIADYERTAQERQEAPQNWTQRVAEGVGGAAKFVGEFGMTGGFGGPAPTTAAGRVARAAANVGRMAAIMPSQNNVYEANAQAGRAPDDPRGLAPELARSLIQAMVFEASGQAGGRALQGPGVKNALGRTAIAGVGFNLSSQAGALIEHALGLNAGYGALGDIVAGKYGKAAADLAQQFLTGAVFHGVHEVGGAAGQGSARERLANLARYLKGQQAKGMSLNAALEHYPAQGPEPGIDREGEPTPEPGRNQGGGLQPVPGEFPARPQEAPQAPPAAPAAPPAAPAAPEPPQAPPAAPEPPQAPPAAPEPPQAPTPTQARPEAPAAQPATPEASPEAPPGPDVERMRAALKSIGLASGTWSPEKVLSEARRLGLDRAEDTTRAPEPMRPATHEPPPESPTPGETTGVSPGRQTWNHAGTKFADAPGGAAFEANGTPYRVEGRMGQSPSDGKPYLDVRAYDRNGQEHGRLLLDRKESGGTDYSAADLRVHDSLRGEAQKDTRRSLVNGLYDFAHEELGELLKAGDPAGGEIVPSRTQSEGGKAVWARNASLKAGEEGPPPEPAPKRSWLAQLRAKGKGQKVETPPGSTFTTEGATMERAERTPAQKAQALAETLRVLARASEQARALRQQRQAGRPVPEGAEEAALNRAMVEADDRAGYWRGAHRQAVDEYDDPETLTHVPENRDAIERDARSLGVEPEALRREIAAQLQADTQSARPSHEGQGAGGPAPAQRGEAQAPAAVPEAPGHGVTSPPALTPQESMETARLGRETPRRYAAEAVEQGLDPEELHRRAAFLRKVDAQHVAEHNEVLREADKALGEFGWSIKRIRQAVGRGRLGQGSDVRGMDEVGELLARRLPALYDAAAENPDEFAFRILKEGYRKPISEEASYQEALAEMGQNKAMDDERQRLLRAGHDPRRLEEVARAEQAAGQEDARSEGVAPVPPGEPDEGAGDEGDVIAPDTSFDFGEPAPAAPGSGAGGGPPGGGPAGPTPEPARRQPTDLFGRPVFESGPARQPDLIGDRHWFEMGYKDAKDRDLPAEVKDRAGQQAYDKGFSAGRLAERSGVHGPADMEESFQRHAAVGNVERPAGDLRALAERFVRDESGAVDLGRLWTLVRGKYDELKGAARAGLDFFSKLGGRVAPATQRLSRPAADAIARLDGAAGHAHYETEAMIDRVLGPGAEPADRARVGAVLTERRLRYAHQAFMAESAKASANAARLRAEALQDQAEGYRRHPPEVWAEMVSSESRRATDMMRKGQNVTSIIGKQGSPFQSLADYAQAIQDPKVRQALQNWDRFMVPEMEKNFRTAQGMEDTDPINSLTQIPGSPVNLKAVLSDEDVTPTTAFAQGRGNLRNVKQGKLAFTNEFSGSAPAYDFDLGNMIANTLREGYQKAAKANLYRTLVSEGLAEWGKPGETHYFDGVKARGDLEAKPPPGTQEAERGQTTLYADPRVYDELRQVLAPDRPVTNLGKVASLFNGLNLAGISDALAHTRNLASMLTRDPRMPDRFLSRALDVIRNDTQTKGALAELARIDALQSPRPHGWFPQLGGADPTSWVGRFLETVDHAMRLAASDAFDMQAKKGGIVADETAKRNFINQIGNYSKRTQSKVVAWLRDSGLGPFATAGANWNVNAIRALTGTTGYEPTSLKSDVALRAGMLGRLAAAAAVVPVMNYLLHGRVDGDDNTPLGAIKIGTKADGSTSYVNVASWLGIDRGTRLVGLNAFLEGARTGRPVAHSADKAAEDAVMGWAHPAMGPFPTAVHTAVTGENNLGINVAQKPGKGFDWEKRLGLARSQKYQNVKAALENVNPAVAAALAANRPQRGAPPTAAERAEELARPLGYGTRKHPPGKDVGYFRR